MPSVNPYINFAGNCEEAFNYYKSIFGGEFVHVGRYSDMPGNEEMKDTDLNKIMHISLPIGNGTMLMGSDSGGEWASQLNQGNNITLSITADSKEQADEFYTKLSEGGQATMPMTQQFWGDYFGMCTDKFGINWMISFNEKGKDNY